MKAFQVTLDIRQAPLPDETCSKCGADASHYVKHPRLKGGTCTECGGVWLSINSVGEEMIEIDVRVEPTADGGAILHFD